MTLARSIALAALAAAGAAHAEVADKGANGFRLKYVAQVAAPPARVYQAIGEIGRWWSDDHTYSGKAANFTLPLQANACLCEALPGGGGVRHGVVEAVVPNQLVRLEAALGPLQDEGVATAWAFALKPKDGGTELTVTYNVGGLRPEMAAAAPGVDGVLGEQVARFKRYVETGKP
ncbi:MAG TPA: ATPase [Phenylobacterium sp.]|nr:ATPase [Phenylobacterium sp.]